MMVNYLFEAHCVSIAHLCMILTLLAKQVDGSGGSGNIHMLW
jgi:hypothetical protein